MAKQIAEVSLSVVAPSSDEEQPNDVPDDPWCDDMNPKTVGFESISAAAYKIKSGIVRTPCDVSQVFISVPDVK